MSTRRAFLLVVGVALVTSWIGWLVIHRSGPRYHGKNFNFWFHQLYTHLPYQQNGPESQELREEALDALKGMGTDAVPLLLAECFSTYQDSSFRSNVFRVLGEFPEPFKTEPFVPADFAREAAAMALVHARPPGRLVLPAITNAFASTNQFFRRAAAELLETLGDDAINAVPLYRVAFASSDFVQQYLALQSYSRVHQSLPQLVPDVVGMLTNFSSGGNNTFWYLLGTLAAIGPPASDALPLLKVRLTTETNYSRCLRLAGTIVSISANEWPVLEPMVDEVRTNWTSSGRNQVLITLANTGPNAKPAIPFLLEAVRQMEANDEAGVWLAINALLKMRAEPGVVVPVLEAKIWGLNERQPDSRSLNLAVQILRFDPTNKFAIEFLGKTALSDSGLNYWSLQSLCSSNTTAWAAKPVLIAATTNSRPAIRTTAARALARLRNQPDPKLP